MSAPNSPPKAPTPVLDENVIESPGEVPAESTDVEMPTVTEVKDEIKSTPEKVEVEKKAGTETGAEATPELATTSTGAAGPAATDSLFEPSLEMMVNDFDDERTLEEEEALAATEADDPNAELSNLQRVCTIRNEKNMKRSN